MKKYFQPRFLLILVAFAFTPIVSFAADPINQQFTGFYYNLIITTINSVLVPILLAIAFITFLWGVYKYFILGSDDEAQRKTGRDFVLWGVIGFVVIFSVWGLVSIVRTTLIPTSQQSLGDGVLKPPTIKF